MGTPQLSPAPRREQVDTFLAPYYLHQPISAPPQLGTGARYCAGEEQNLYSTPTRAEPLHLEQLRNSAPPAARTNVAWGPGGDPMACGPGGDPMARQQLSTKADMGTDLSILDFAAIRDDSVAVSSTVDTPVQVCMCFLLSAYSLAVPSQPTVANHFQCTKSYQLQEHFVARLSSNEHRPAQNVQQPYTNSPTAFHHQQHAAGPHITPCQYQDQSPLLQHRSSRLSLPGCSTRHDMLTLCFCLS